MEKVTVIGLGYVGLPLSLVLWDAGFEVFGLDVREDYIKQVESGTVVMAESFKGKPIQDVLKEAVASGRYHPTTDPDKALGYEKQQIIMTVGIPLSDNKADTTMLEGALSTLAPRLKRGALVIARSTLIVGYTRNFIARRIYDLTSLCSRVDYHLAFSSERMAEGAAFEELVGMTTPVAGITPEATEAAATLLERMGIKNVVRASCPEAVETAKVFENIARDVNIALANEYANFCAAYNLDTREVLDLVRTHKRVGFLHQPGPGVGGHCLPQAMHYLKPTADGIGAVLPVIETARQANIEQPVHIAEIAIIWVKKNAVPNPKVAILGLAMKDFSTDARWSPAVDIARRISQEQDIELVVWDPLVDRSHIDINLNFADSLEEAVKDACVVITGARQLPFPEGGENADIKLLSGMKKTGLVIDSRFAFDRDEAIEASYEYIAL